MKKGRFTRPLRLSRNYSFADKQERIVDRSKVVRKFLYRNFLPPEVQKGRYPCAASRPRCADTCSPFLSICRANAVSCALPREMLKNADYTTFSTASNARDYSSVLFFIHSNVDNSAQSYSVFPSRISAISSISCSQSSSVPSVCRKPVPISLTKACPMSI